MGQIDLSAGLIPKQQGGIDLSAGLIPKGNLQDTLAAERTENAKPLPAQYGGPGVSDYIGEGIKQGAYAIPNMYEGTIKGAQDIVAGKNQHNLTSGMAGVGRLAQQFNPLPPDQGQGIVNRVAQGAGVVAGAAMTGLPEAEGAPGKPFISPKQWGEKWYSSSLKPPLTNSIGKNAGLVQAGLENKIPVSADGLEKIGGLIQDLNQQISATIASKPGQSVNKYAVASRLSDTARDLSQQVNPVKDLQKVADSGNEFIATNPAQIAASDAQAMKVGTYKQLQGKYGELGNAAIESQKALARGLKEELSKAFPELDALNARESKLFDLQPALERAVQRNSNGQLIGIGTPMVGIAGATATGSLPAAGALAALKAAIDNPIVKSRLAIALNQAGKNIPGGITLSQANAKIAAYSAALAGPATKSGSEQGTGQTATQ